MNVGVVAAGDVDVGVEVADNVDARVEAAGDVEPLEESTDSDPLEVSAGSDPLVGLDPAGGVCWLGPSPEPSLERSLEQSQD